MFLIYSFLIRLYGLAIATSSLVNRKAKLLYRGRKKQDAHINRQIQQWGNCKKIWIHAASYGEYEMAIPIIKRLLENDSIRLIVSFHSPSGYVYIQHDTDRILKIYLPLDSYSLQNSMVNIIQPNKVVFIKYEFWFNLLRVLNSKEIPYYYTSLHLNQDSYLLSPIMKPFTNLIRASRRIYCHNEESQSILESKDFRNTEVFGDTRIVQVLQNKKATRGKVNWQKKQATIGFGSIQAEEYKMVADFINKSDKTNFLVAPHDIDHKTINDFVKLLNEEITLYSTAADTTNRILIVDTIGDLRYLYRNCDAVYVGGGFNKGPHNILEPLVYGLPTCCGPNIHKFPMAQQLINSGLLTIISEQSDLPAHLEKMLAIDPNVFKIKTDTFFDLQENQISSLISELVS